MPDIRRKVGLVTGTNQGLGLALGYDACEAPWTRGAPSTWLRVTAGAVERLANGRFELTV